MQKTLKEVSIKNIKFDKAPSVGTPKLYYKNINNFASSSLGDENLAIENELNFNVTGNDEADLSTPTLYNNCANPIVLSYVNEYIKNDYTITDTSNPITYNGSLLKRCQVPIDSINCNISFDIYITNNKDEKYKCSVHLSIPYEKDGSSIYDGSITVKDTTNFSFYRYE